MTEQTEELLILNATYAARLTALNSFELVNSCVETTRLTLLILEKLGIDRARPQAVHVRVFNRAAYISMMEEVPYELWPQGAHALGTDAPQEVQARNANGWAGHLVVVVRDEAGRRLVDGSADQFNRPGSLNVPGPVGMRVEGVWSPMDPQFRVLIDNETIIEYRPMIGENSKVWKTFPAWVKDPEWFEEMATQIAESIKGGWSYVRDGVPSE